MRRLPIPALLLTVALPACDGDPPTSPTLTEGPVALTEILSRSTSGLEAQTRMVVRTNAAFELAWEELFADVDMPDPVPVVDFESRMVLIAGSGDQDTDCHKIVFNGALSDGTDVTVTVTETAPTDECVCSDLDASPVAVASMPRADGVSFVNISVEVCDE